MAKMRISPELKKLIEKYRCVKDTEGMSPAKVYKLVGENENLRYRTTMSISGRVNRKSCSMKRSSRSAT